MEGRGLSILTGVVQREAGEALGERRRMQQELHISLFWTRSILASNSKV